MKDLNLKVTDTLNGPMLYLPNDQYVGRSLDLYGEFSKGEQEFFAFASQRGGAAIDVGANLGAHSLLLAKRFEHLFAFEPQPLLHKLLVANLSDCLNTTAYNAACADSEGLLWLPELDYSSLNNFGGVGKDCIDHLPEAERKAIPMIKVQQRAIDKCEAIWQTERISLIKVDVEGMEKEVLEGARKLIARDQPILYVENDKPQKSKELLAFIYDVLAYRAWWHITYLYNPANFKHNPENVFLNMASFNLICLPEGHWAKVDSALQCTPDNPFVPAGCQV